MNCHECDERLDDYVDRTLAADDAAAMAVHLDTCGRCRAIAADFSTIRAAARSLAPEIPAPHVWTRIAAAVEAERQRTRWFSVPRWRAAAAAAVLATVLAGGAWLAWRQMAAPQPSRGLTASALEPVETELRLAEEHYTKAIAGLELLAQEHATALDRQTAEVLQANMAVIDQAIGQSRDALRSEPASQVARESLFEALRSKVALLQDTIALINEMRKGNQEGAARIVSGMNP